MKKIGT